MRTPAMRADGDGSGGRIVPVLAANVLFGAGLFAHAFLYNFYLGEAGHGAAVMGNAAAALTAGGLTALVPAGILVDRAGPRAAFAVAAVLAAAGLCAGALATGVAPVYAAAFLAGSGTALWRVSMGPLLMRVAEGRLRARVFSWNVALLVGTGAGWTALSGAGPAWLQRTLGMGVAGSLRAALLVGAGATLLAAAAIAIAPRVARPEPAGEGARASLRAIPPAVRVGVVLVAVWMTGSALVLPFFNVFFTNVHGLTIGRTGVVLAVSQALTAVAVAAGGEAAARLGPGRALTVWMFVMPPALWALAVAGSPGLAIAFFLVQGVVPAATNPLIDQVLLEQATPERQGVVSSARNGATELSGLLGASLGGRLLAAGSFGSLLATAGGVAAAGAVGLSIWLRKTQSVTGPSRTRPRNSRQIRSA